MRENWGFSKVLWLAPNNHRRKHVEGRPPEPWASEVSNYLNSKTNCCIGLETELQFLCLLAATPRNPCAACATTVCVIAPTPFRSPERRRRCPAPHLQERLPRCPACAEASRPRPSPPQLARESVPSVSASASPPRKIIVCRQDRDAPGTQTGRRQEKDSRREESFGVCIDPAQIIVCRQDRDAPGTQTGRRQEKDSRREERFGVCVAPALLAGR
jgi:hypothetical protein